MQEVDTPNPCCTRHAKYRMLALHGAWELWKLEEDTSATEGLGDQNMTPGPLLMVRFRSKVLFRSVMIFSMEMGDQIKTYFPHSVHG